MSHQKSINKRLAASKHAAEVAPEVTSNKKSIGSKNKKSK